MTENGGVNVTARGVCWSTSPNPTINDAPHTTDGSGIGTFTSSITGLTAGTTYYVRAYATNSEGTAYGDQVSFTTLALPSLLDESFESDGIPTGWTVIDNDADGHNWLSSSETVDFYTNSGARCIVSASYLNNVGPLTPDNWLITPALSIPTGITKLEFYVRGQDPDYVAENFGVYVSTTGNAVANFSTSLLQETATSEYVKYTVDLSTYAGQTIYLAFRHYNSSDQYFLNLDDVRVYQEN